MESNNYDFLCRKATYCATLAFCPLYVQSLNSSSDITRFLYKKVSSLNQMKQKKEDRIFNIVIVILILLLIAYSLSFDIPFKGKQVACGNSLVEPGEQCDPPWTGACSIATASLVPLVCGGSCQCQPQNAPGVIPYIESLSRDIVRSPQSGYETVRVAGANFINPSNGQPAAMFAEGIPLLPTAYTVINGNAIDVRVSPVMTPRSYHVYLQSTNPLTGQPLRSNSKMFTIVGRPNITVVSPQVVPSNNQLNIVTLTGTNFVPYNFEQTNVAPSEAIINSVRYNPTLVRVNGYAQIEILVPPYSPVGLYSIFIRNTPIAPGQLPAIPLLESNTIQVYVAPPGCGNTVIESGEQCDPPGSSCQSGGRCNNACQCNAAQQPTQPSTPSGGSGSSGASVTRLDFSRRDSIETLVRRGNVLIYSLGRRSYSIRINDITRLKVTLRPPAGDLVEIPLEDSGDLLIDSDNTPDLTAEVLEISRTLRATIKFTEYASAPSVPPPVIEPPIARPRPVPPPSIEPEPQYPYEEFPEGEYFPVEEKTQRSPWTYILSGLIVIAVIGLIAYGAILYMKRKKGKASSFGFS